ncbi:uncharacterized protein LOC142234956 [Haematobia irritans]|uniref:Putative antimicrobial peptide resistance and lipid a acylation protein pagp n=2 Tax=Haematobia irritans TaxID=7368 RepID=A0A1L8EB87_HAEIR
MTPKLCAVLFIVVVVAVELNHGAPTTTEPLSVTTYAPFESRSADELAKYLLQTTVHKYDSKIPNVEHRLKHFMEAIDILITESVDDREKLEMYKTVNEMARESLRAIKEDSAKCGLYMVAMTKLRNITDLVTDLKDAQLWNYWTLSNIDEKTLFVTLGYHLPQDFKESQMFFEENPDLANEAKTKAENFIDENCPNYKEFFYDLIKSY